MAGLTTRKRGKTWEYRFEIAKIGGERKWKSKGGFQTKKAAVEAGTKALNEYNNTGKSFTPSEISVSDYMDFWIEQYCRNELKDTTTDGYVKKIKNHIKPEIGEYKLKNVDYTLLQGIITKKYNDGYSMNTLSGIRGILNNSFQYAFNNLHYISSNPASGLTLPTGRKEPKIPTRKKERQVISIDEFNRIIERFPEGHSCHIPLQIGFWTGLRIGEVFALSWDDINFDNKTLSVNRQIQMDEKIKQWQFTPPKYESYRTIKIDDQLIDLLKRTKEKKDKCRIFYEEHYVETYMDKTKHLNENGVGEKIDLIMRYDNGEYIQSRVTQHMSRIIHYQLNMPEFDFHSLRHSHATMLKEEKVDPVTIQRRLGHKTIKVTLETYTHVTENMQNSAIDVLNRLKK